MICCPQRCLKTPSGGRRHPTVWPFLCPFAKADTFSGFDFLLYLHLVMPGVPDMSKTSV